jgi:N-acetylated-alpha-linked acidic dipeptidase
MFRRVLIAGSLALALGASPLAQQPASPSAPVPPLERGPTLSGFAPARRAAHLDLERRFDAELKAENLRTWMRRLAARPHHLGSPYGKDNAEFMAGLFRSWGYDVAITDYQVLFPTPLLRKVELVAPTKFVASLSEPPLREDATSNQTAEALPPYNVYSPDGDVTAELVYVNYGVPADYDELERRGIDVKGKIVIARYGGSWRGIKPKVAAEHGAVGCLIYSDPREDGFFQGDVYPTGGWRNDRAAQRGSVMDLPMYPGDPLTPGVGATKDAKRPPFKEAATLMKIPVLPISYADAQPLLKALGGPTVPAAWRGALPMTYHIGPGPARVHLQLQFDWKLATTYSVIATLKGSELPDQWVVRGNHHDAWVNGASDPVSGMIAVMEEARAIGVLVKAGWKPKRTIVFAGWDGEEQALLGSTEWVEDHAQELGAKAVAYVNSDMNGRGLLDVGGSHSLERFANEIAQVVTEPTKGGTVGDRLIASSILNGSPEQRAALRDTRLFEIDALGSGSDYSPFLQHLGIASLNIGFGGEGAYGQYHSIYDSIAHFERFMDPDYAYGVALAKVGGRTVMRIADADLLPFEFTRAAGRIKTYVADVQKLADTLRTETTEHNRRIDDGVFTLAANPSEKVGTPKRRAVVPAFDFAPLTNAVDRLTVAARRYDAKAGAAVAAGATGPAIAAANGVLLTAERALTRKEGLPRRPWFTHQIYAPGFYTGYGVKTLPAVREAIEERDFHEATAQIPKVAATIEAYAADIERAAAALER